MTDDIDTRLPAEEYAGPATIRSGDTAVPVEVTLAGAFEPIDGHFHWHGRVARNEALDNAFGSGDRVEIDTGSGVAEGRLSDIDPWQRFRIAGVGAPPF